MLRLPKAQEACPHGLAPTTSTLMQLALGDALAVALLEARGFTATDFKTFHPGGKLGASLTHVGDIMHSGENMPLVPLGTSHAGRRAAAVAEALWLRRGHRRQRQADRHRHRRRHRPQPVAQLLPS